MVGLIGCVFVIARLCRLGSTPGPGVVLCWLALLEPFALLRFLLRGPHAASLMSQHILILPVSRRSGC